MSVQTEIGGFTIVFNGVSQVEQGYEWSYTIYNDGSEQDVSNWVLELQKCTEAGQYLSCSSGKCEVVTQDCPDQQCPSFTGIKFDNLSPDQPIQTFTFILPVKASEVVGCLYLKNGLLRRCGQIIVPNCDEPPLECPPCPEHSLRDGKLFTEQLSVPNTDCKFRYLDEQPAFYLCIDRVQLTSGRCEQWTEFTMCEGSESAQILRCYVPLDYVTLNGELQVFWQLNAQLDTVCSQDAVLLKSLHMSSIKVDEICYFCEGERPSFDEQDICGWFIIDWLQLSESGELSYRITFLGCGHETHVRVQE